MTDTSFSYIQNANPAYIEDLYKKYQTNPSLVDEKWRLFFEGYDFSKLPEDRITPAVSDVYDKEVSVVKLINAYRARGHLISKTSPLEQPHIEKSDLELKYFGLTDDDLDTEFEAGSEIFIGKSSLRNILAHLKQTYCGAIGTEFRYCRDENLRQWFYREMEGTGNIPSFSNSEKKHILTKIDEAISFENFLQTKFVGKKRFSLEGVEALIPALDAAVEEATEHDVKEMVLGMAHRGRLNVLANIFGKNYDDLFSEFEGAIGPFDKKGGDVKYHLGQSSNITLNNNKKMHLTLVPNPSHLEAVNPVIQGLVYAKLDLRYSGDASKIIPVLIHGDAAYSGQGVNYEIANISKLDGYKNKGTIHIVVNNQIGFTTNPQESRSSVYCTDIAKVTDSPVFHVNAQNAEAVVQVMKMAVKIRQLFCIDVYVDIIGYRKFGHNEGDEPRFTQPNMYHYIKTLPDLYEIYLKQLIEDNVVTKNEAQKKRSEIKAELQKKLDEAKKNLTVSTPKLSSSRSWRGLRLSRTNDFSQSLKTGVNQRILDLVAKTLVNLPSSFTIYDKMNKILHQRKTLYFDNNTVDWGLAELLAYGSLLLENYPVRLSGQDCQRGTFSHRHATIIDHETEKLYIPLNNLHPDQAKFQVYNSSLSEYGILGFEFGYSMARPRALTIWEAQFGDFANGAQIIIDQYICSSQSKWGRISGLTLFLPHGHEGQGPEHSSGRIERFLQLCADNNMYVVNTTTPSNFFHLLRRQVKNKFRVPLVVFTPKSLLRHPRVKSPISELTSGSFTEVIDDPNVKTEKVKRLVLCSGKVYYDLLEKQLEEKLFSVALIRLEQLYPLPMKQLENLKIKYAHVKDWVWLQEEPHNQGSLTHLLRHLTSFNLRFIARNESPSTATGNEKIHKRTQAEIISEAFK